MGSKLSRDLVVDVFSRLPVKSLMRFKCVCKFFNDLITSDHDLMDKHYKFRKAKVDCVVLETGCLFREYCLLYKEPSEYNEIGCIYFDIPTTPKAQWVKCCQGLLCLISVRNSVIKLDRDDYLSYDIWIYNPSIRKLKALPSVTVTYRPPSDAFVVNQFGFGISSDMTWKVVMLLEFCSIDDDSTIHQMTLVYSQVGGDSWSLRQINSVTPRCDLESENNDFYLKGRYYWRVDRFCVEPYDRFLIWFDMNDEVFGTVRLPDMNISSVSIMNETIAVVGYSGWIDFSCIEIWLMIENDNSTYWHKQASINANSDNESWIPIGIWTVVGELLVSLEEKVEWDSDNSDPDHAKRGVPYFMSLDLVTQERKKFSVSKKRKSISSIRNCDIYARVYDESLHFL
nr:putative F-box protein At1g19160 [Ipomoea batatas]